MSNPTPTTTTPPPPPAGWYFDGTDPRKRYWDGSQWTEHFDTPKVKAPRRRLPLWVVFIFIAVTMFIGISIGAGAAPRPSNSITALEATIADRDVEIETLQSKIREAQAGSSGEPAATPSVTTRAPVTFSGEGELDTAKSTLSGDYSVAWQTFGSCYYSAVLKPGNTTVISAQDALTGTSNVYGLSDGDYYVSMITGPAPECKWSVTLTPSG